MLTEVDEFDGSCLSVIAERKRQWQQQHGADERGISTRAILSRLENWIIGGKATTEMRPGRNVDRNGTDRGWDLCLSGKSGQSSFLVARTNASVSSEPIRNRRLRRLALVRAVDLLCNPRPRRGRECRHRGLYSAFGRSQLRPVCSSAHPFRCVTNASASRWGIVQSRRSGCIAIAKPINVIYISDFRSELALPSRAERRPCFIAYRRAI
jgi:hypothetical protein